jgi:hypothetical protein
VPDQVVVDFLPDLGGEVVEVGLQVGQWSAGAGRAG